MNLAYVQHRQHITNSMQQSPSSDDDNCSARQEVSGLLWNTNSMSYSQQLSTGHYPELKETSPDTHTLLLLFFFKIHIIMHNIKGKVDPIVKTTS
jgi:hypothetical protein